MPGAEAARQGEAVQPYCNNKPAAGASEGTGTATALPPSLLCACPEHSRKWGPRQPRGAHRGPHPSCSPRAPRRARPRAGEARAWSPAARRSGSGAAGGRDAHAHGRVHSLTRALGHCQSRARPRAHRLQERRPGGCNRRRSALELSSSLKDFKVLMLSPCRATFLKLWIAWGGGGGMFCFVF